MSFFSPRLSFLFVSFRIRGCLYMCCCVWKQQESWRNKEPAWNRQMIARVIKDDNQNRNSLSFFLFVYESCSVARLPVDSTLYNRVRALSSFLDDWKKEKRKTGLMFHHRAVTWWARARTDDGPFGHWSCRNLRPLYLCCCCCWPDNRTKLKKMFIYRFLLFYPVGGQVGLEEREKDFLFVEFLLTV